MLMVFQTLFFVELMKTTHQEHQRVCLKGDQVLYKQDNLQ